MPKIRVLSDTLVNQIAAGEVIENSASVVKELVDNAIDAEASQITVEIHSGGRHLIRISDDGCGMAHDDALLCLEKNATSKIMSFDDLQQLCTMGFRGEAIPSIASVSKFTLITSPAEQEQGKATIVVVDGGKIVQCSPSIRARGTTVEVKSLFFNVPVRKKFLKSPNHDAAEVYKVVSAFALGHPHIAFELISDGKIMLKTTLSPQPKESLKERINEILGSEFAVSALPIQMHHPVYTLEGYIGRPSDHRNNRSKQQLFINRRAVYSPLIAAAIREGYGHALPAQRFPSFLVHLTIPAPLVDINVHPQKREVRLRQEHFVKELIQNAVRETLLGASYVVDAPLTPSFLPSFPKLDHAHSAQAEHVASTPHPEPIVWASHISHDPQQHIRAFAQPTHMPKVSAFGEGLPWEAFSTRDKMKSSSTPLQQSSEDLPTVLQILAASSLQRPDTPTPTPHMPPSAAITADLMTPSPRILAVMPRYILIDAATMGETMQESSGICVVDQYAAHFRVLYDLFAKRMRDLSSTENALSTQMLLIPHTIECSTLEAMAIREHLQQLRSLGIGIQETGPQTFMIDAIPLNLDKEEIQVVIADLLHELREETHQERSDRDGEKRLVMAASNAMMRRKNRCLSMEAAQQLVNDLIRCQQPHQCPLGTPTMIYITPKDLEKRFA